MTKKHFIAMANVIKSHNILNREYPFTLNHLDTLADFCKSQNPNFNKERWLDYINVNKKMGKS